MPRSKVGTIINIRYRKMELLAPFEGDFSWYAPLMAEQYGFLGIIGKYGG